MCDRSLFCLLNNYKFPNKFNLKGKIIYLHDLLDEILNNQKNLPDLNNTQLKKLHNGFQIAKVYQ